MFTEQERKIISEKAHLNNVVSMHIDELLKGTKPLLIPTTDISSKALNSAMGTIRNWGYNVKHIKGSLGIMMLKIEPLK